MCPNFAKSFQNGTTPIIIALKSSQATTSRLHSLLFSFCVTSLDQNLKILTSHSCQGREFRNGMENEEETEFMGSQRRTSGNHRSHLLYTCGASLLTTAQKAYQRAEKFSGPLGSLSQTLASVVSPIVIPLQHQWLSILAFFDNQILAVENLVMAIFPPSEHVFNKIDELVLLIEGLPKLFDDTIDHIPALVYQLPLFPWASKNLIVGLKFVLATITDCNSNQEREIMVDIKCDEPSREPSDKETEGAIKDEAVDILKPSSMEKVHVVADEKCRQSIEDDIREVENTCKVVMEALEKMEIIEKKAMKGDTKRRMVGKDEVIARANENESEKHFRDSILELFEEGWEMKPLAGKKGH